MSRATVRSFLASALVVVLHAGAIAGDPPPPSTWITDIQEHIEASEYEIGPDREGTSQAPNRAQGFRTFFEHGRIHLEPRVESGSPWEWGLTWIAYGRGEQTWPIPEAVLSISRARAEYRRGSLVEWYENAPRGLEQGFLLPYAPEELMAGEGARSGSSTPLHLDLALSGTLSPIVAADGQAIDFVAGDGTRVLRYAELIVTDARGAKVRSWMEAFVRADVRIVRLVLDADDAVFPLTVDPLTTGPMFAVQSNQAGALLGASVATAGDINGDGFSDILVGVPSFDNGHTNEGQVRVFFGLPSGLVSEWAYEANVAGGALLGSSVATAGDVNGDGYADVIVGAPGYDNPENNEGRAYLFLGSASGLPPTPAWTVESNLNIASYGSAVGTAGDVNGDGYSDVIVGAADAARAYLYLGSPSGLSTTHAWEASSSSTSRFGAAVGTAGDVNGDGYADVIIGAPNYENGQTAEGAVFVYHGSAAGLSTTPWLGEGGQAGGLYGSSVGTAGDVNGDGYADAIAGAPLYDNGQADEGLAFVYFGSSTGLSFSPAWFGESGQIAGHYGFSVGTAGDVNGDGYADVLVAGERITNGQSNEGRAWLYYGGPALAQIPAWTHETNQTGAGIKVAVATAGDFNGDGYADVLVGFPNYDNGETDEGEVRLFLGSVDPPAQAAGWSVVGPQAESVYGHVVAGAGDVNGDGYADVFVSAPWYDTGIADAGRVFLYPGGAFGLNPNALWTADGDQILANLGAFAGGPAGDVNGDGYDDLLVGARSYDNGQQDEGRAYLYLGSASGPSATPAWIAEGNLALAHFGTWLDTAGDVNGDGYADVVIGAYGYDDGTGIGRGRAFLYLGSAAGLSPTASWTGVPQAGDASYAFSVAAAGDVNRDGYGDVLVGAPGGVYIVGDVLPPAPPGTSRVYLYFGSSSGLSSTVSWVADGTPIDGLGTTVAGAGDVNGDGYADVLLGAPFFNDQLGRVAVYLGSASGPNPVPSWTVQGTGSATYGVGYSGDTAGDVNGDGYADLVIGGEPRLYLGSAAGPGLLPARIFSGGPIVAGAGDVNGDGYAEIVVGSWSPDDNQGMAQLFYGNGRRGLPLIPVQRLADDSRAIARLGTSDGPAFRVGSLSARSPFGRGQAKLEVEVKRLDQPFDGLSTAVGDLEDTGTTGTPLSVLAEDLLPGTPFHWRMRLRYDPGTTPLASHSRWFTRPWRGWSESMLRTGTATPAGRASGLIVSKAGGSITLNWAADSGCVDEDTYAIYAGTLGDFTSHAPLTCDTDAAHTWDVTPLAGNRYFLVVPRNASAEGSYGKVRDGTERPASASACVPQQIGCP